MSFLSISIRLFIFVHLLVFACNQHSQLKIANSCGKRENKIFMIRSFDFASHRSWPYLHYRGDGSCQLLWILTASINWIRLKNERIYPFLGTFVIYPKILYRKVPRCFGIFAQIWSRISNDSSNIIWLIISISMLKMCAF